MIGYNLINDINWWFHIFKSLFQRKSAAKKNLFRKSRKILKSYIRYSRWTQQPLYAIHRIRVIMLEKNPGGPDSSANSNDKDSDEYIIFNVLETTGMEKGKINGN